MVTSPAIAGSTIVSGHAQAMTDLDELMCESVTSEAMTDG